MCFRTMAFGCREASPLEARLLPMKGVIVHKHHQAAAGGSPLHNDYNIQLSRNFREKTCYFRELEKKLSRGFPT